MKSCNKMIKCWDNSFRPCKRESGHKEGCNPFYNEAPKKPKILNLFKKVLDTAGI
jgi:hypothetical protein